LSADRRWWATRHVFGGEAARERSAPFAPTLATTPLPRGEHLVAMPLDERLQRTMSGTARHGDLATVEGPEPFGRGLLLPMQMRRDLDPQAIGQREGPSIETAVVHHAQRQAVPNVVGPAFGHPVDVGLLDAERYKDHSMDRRQYRTPDLAWTSRGPHVDLAQSATSPMWPDMHLAESPASIANTPSMRDPARTAMSHDRRDATRSLTTAIAAPATRPVSAAWCDLPA